MTKTIIDGPILKLATDTCTNYSLGQRVFAYLEKKLTDDDEIEEFVLHAGDCTFCMQTIVKWHYDCVITEMNDKAEASSNSNGQRWDWSLGAAAQGNVTNTNTQEVSNELGSRSENAFFDAPKYRKESKNPH
jgi:hypothetical protein